VWQTKWLTEGWHRFYAHQKAGKDAIPCQVRQGTFRDALIEAAGSNHDHGMPRSNEDKRKAVHALLGENERDNCGWSNRELADMCRVSESLVRTIKKETSEVESALKRKKDSNGILLYMTTAAVADRSNDTTGEIPQLIPAR
jgi:hypothetical protein